MNPVEQKIYEIIRDDVCRRCKVIASDCYSPHEKRCLAGYERQAAAIYKQIVEPMEKTWQPIETVPMNGTKVLLTDKEGMTVADARAYVSSRFQNPMTHWMPLPSPPKEESAP